METVKIYTGVVKGKPVDQESINNAYLYFEGEGVDITIEIHKTKRSKAQNNFLWGYVWSKIQKYIFEIRKERFPLQEIHDNYKAKGYFGFKKSIDGDDIPKGSSESTTVEFAEAIDRLQKEWAERGLVLPDPQQTEFLEEE